MYAQLGNEKGEKDIYKLTELIKIKANAGSDGSYQRPMIKPMRSESMFNDSDLCGNSKQPF